jgi:hypothetical protein
MSTPFNKWFSYFIIAFWFVWACVMFKLMVIDYGRIMKDRKRILKEGEEIQKRLEESTKRRQETLGW